MCESFTLDKESATEFILTGDVQFKDLQQQAEVCGTQHTNNAHSWPGYTLK